jgi:hypothetical protein
MLEKIQMTPGALLMIIDRAKLIFVHELCAPSVSNFHVKFASAGLFLEVNLLDIPWLF